MTTVAVDIDGTDYSDYVIEADVWRDTLTGIGRWQVILDPIALNWVGTFTVDNDVQIDIDGVTMMLGYLDDVSPYLEFPGVFKDMWRLTGRDYSMDLAQLYLNQTYYDMDIRNIVNLALIATGSEVTYIPALPAAPFRTYEWKRTFLSDGIRELANMANRDFYVQDNVARSLHFFPIGDVGEHQAVDLISLVGDSTNNILRIEVGEQIGYETKNHLDIHAGGVHDHWSDGNIEDGAHVPPIRGWVGAEVDGNTLVANEVGPPPILVLQGNTSIKWFRTVAGLSPCSMELDFTNANIQSYYSYGATVDLSERIDCHVMIRTNQPLIPRMIRPHLIDSAGKRIAFFARIGNAVPVQGDDTQGYGPTDELAADKWYRCKFPVGEELVVTPGITDQHWYRVAGAAPFDWSNVENILFSSTTNNNPHENWIDDLTIPGLEAHAVRQNVASQIAYGVRMKPIFRGDLTTQLELNTVAEDYLEKYKDPMVTLKCTASGQTGSIYAGQTLDVRCDRLGINALTKYRILSLHHRVALSPDRNEIIGYPFTTEYVLVRLMTNGDTQKVDTPRANRYWFPEESMTMDTRYRDRKVDNTVWARER